MWSSVDAYLAQELVPEDKALSEVLRDSAAAGLPAINVTALQGMFLQLLARLKGANRILEIGTLGGYSAIWLARALSPGGRVVTLELEPVYAELAAANIARAGYADSVEIRLGRAADVLRSMIDDGEEAFDIVFIDADKPSNPIYLELSLQLARPGTVIVCDNVVREGKVVDRCSTDPNVVGVRKFIELVAEHPRLIGTAIQTVGSKGYDGFSLAVVGE
jgi:predicted O-methyltransferase YrrM